jgi:hypothetical protein
LDSLDIYKDKPISSSRPGKLDLPDIKFQYDTILKVPCFVAYDIAKNAMAHFRKDNVKYVPLVHYTMWNGSEEELVAYYGSEEGEHVLVTISCRYIDPHFLWFWLWLPDIDKRKKARGKKDPIDELFSNEIISEAATPTKQKFGELFVAPCTVRIRTVKTNLRNFPPVPQKLVNSLKEMPWVKFWDAFKERKYELAASYVKDVLKTSRKKDTESIFLGAVQALCYLLGKHNIEAADEFLRLGIDFHKASLDRYCDLCFFFAIEAAKGIDDLNLSSAAMKRIAEQVPGLTPHLQKEISDILLSYAVSLNTCAGVLCRRTLELTLTQILTKKYRMTTATLIKKAKEAGVLESNARPGLFAILKVAKWKEVLTSSEFKIASRIKDFGDLIHTKGGVGDAIDTKEAIHACIHILRRLPDTSTLT